MNEGKILLVDLSIGKIGEDNSALLGSMLITKIQLAAMNRTNIPEDQRRDFYLYVDEFQNFATESFATILSEARKYRLNLMMAHQYVAQMPEKVSDAVFGNVGTMISFRVGAGDASRLASEFEPVFEVNDLVNLDNHQIYLKMAIDGVTVPAFSASTLPPQSVTTNLIDAIVQSSREKFARPRADVEDYITEWSEAIDLSKTTTPAIQTAKPATSQTQAYEQIVTQSPKLTSSEPKPDTSQSAVELSKSEEKSDEKGNDQHKAASGRLPQNTKVEILKDRFDRAWYAVNSPVELEESRRAAEENNPSTNRQLQKDTKVEEGNNRGGGDSNIKRETDKFYQEPDRQIIPPTLPEKTMDTGLQSGGVGEKEDELISWEQIEQLGLAPSKERNRAEIINQMPDDDLLPLREL